MAMRGEPCLRTRWSPWTKRRHRSGRWTTWHTFSRRTRETVLIAHRNERTQLGDGGVSCGQVRHRIAAFAGMTPLKQVAIRL
jgi:hypothetical protein